MLMHRNSKFTSSDRGKGINTEKQEQKWIITRGADRIKYYQDVKLEENFSNLNEIYVLSLL